METSEMRLQAGTMRARFWFVTLVLSFLYAPVFAAPAARVEFAHGNVTVQAADGRSRALTRGATIEAGDTINTNDGRAQLRFTDDGFVSLYSQTLFRVDEYRWDGVTNGKERSLLSLLKGGLRTVTGRLARVNKKAYMMTTAVATIGIRGTEYTMQLNGGLAGSVAEGEIEVCNAGGCLAVPAGLSYFVADVNTKPAFSEKQTYLAPPQPLGETVLAETAASSTTGTVGGLVDPTVNLLDETASGLVGTLDTTTGSLFGTLDATTGSLIGVTEGAVDSLLGGTALSQPVQGVTGSVGDLVGGTTSGLGDTTGSLIDTLGTTTTGVTGITGGLLGP